MKQRKAIYQWLKDQRGSMSVELVIILPLMLFWLAGAYVFYNAFHKYLKATNATAVIADLISRQQAPSISTIYAMDAIFDKISQTDEPDETYFIFSVVRWTDSDGDGTPELDIFCSEATNTPINEQTSFTEAELLKIMPTKVALEDHLIYVHGYTPYTPIFEWVGIPPVVFENINITPLRFATQLQLDDSCPDPIIQESSESDYGDPYDPENPLNDAENGFE